MKTHEAKQKFKCFVCGKECYRQSHLTNHYKSHLKEGSIQYDDPEFVEMMNNLPEAQKNNLLPMDPLLNNPPPGDPDSGDPLPNDKLPETDETHPFPNLKMLASSGSASWGGNEVEMDKDGKEEEESSENEMEEGIKDKAECGNETDKGVNEKEEAESDDE